MLLIFAIGFYFIGKSIQKHPDSLCENDVNNEQNVCRYYMSNHWTRGWLFQCKNKKLFWLLFSIVNLFSIVKIRFIPWFVQLSHNCSFIHRYSPCCKPVKLGHYSVLRPGILCLLLTLYGKMTYYSTIASFYHIWSREREKYETVIHCNVPVWPV